MNNSTIMGRLAFDPEIKATSSGGNVASFSIAVDRGLSKAKKQEAEAKGHQTVDFIPIKVWGTYADIAAKYLNKGQRVAITGELRNDSYVAKDGQKKSFMYVLASKVDIIDWGTQQEKSKYKKFDDFDDTYGEDFDDFEFKDISNDFTGNVPF